MAALTLIVLDGWGYRENAAHNAISAAKTPTWDRLWSSYPHTLLSASGLDVGLPDQQMGNSEVGHLTLGAGRTVFQELPRIDQSIEDGTFFSNPIFINAFQDLKNTHKALHLIGLVSPGGVHSHENHLIALLKLAKQEGLKDVFIHAILDGRDTPPRSAMTSIKKIQSECEALNLGRIVSLCGRYYAMDRDKRWERTQACYEMLTEGQAAFQYRSPCEALEQAYARGENDEFVKPTLISPFHAIEQGDGLVFFNFRADRARQLSRAFLSKDFIGFKRESTPQLAHFISMTSYASDIPSEVAFQPQPLTHLLGQCISQAGLKQLRIAETEKYAHVTFFFNGGVEVPLAGEDRCLIPSPKVETYDLQPEMSAVELTDKLIEAISSQCYTLIVCNFANPDMVGHTGNFEATVKAIETIDSCLARIVKASLAVNNELIITADHGNAECMFDAKTQQAHTAHTEDPVPFLYIGRDAAIIKEHGILADIAPTILYLLGLNKPSAMTGEVLLNLKE